MILPTDCVRLFAILVLLLLVSLAHVAAAASSPSLAKVFDDYRQPGGPKMVQIGLVVDEVTRIDQQAENFSVVAILQMHWQDPELAFQPESGDDPFRVYRGEAFDKYLDERHLRWPRFSIFNQQGKRYTQNMVIVQMADGQMFYFERFTVMLQAPYLHFSQFPFDSQEFYIDIDLLGPTSLFRFTEQPGSSGLGNLLGLEEWDITRFNTKIYETRQVTGYESSRFRFHLHAERKSQYYKLRILAPIAIIILISWVIFFLQDYRIRIDIAGGNLLLLIAFNLTISHDLPRLGYLTFMDTILFTAFVITSLTVIANVMLRYIEVHGRVGVARRIDHFIIWTYLLLYAAGIAIAYKVYF